MDIFQEYKPIRNKINLLSVEEALAVIWAYGQYLQIDNFNFPKEVEVINEYLQLDVPQKWISEWELELLAKEVIINGRSAAKKGRTLRKWKTLSEIINSLKDFEGRIYKTVGSPGNVLVELIRIAHRQFIWQANSPTLRRSPGAPVHSIISGHADNSARCPHYPRKRTFALRVVREKKR